MANTVINTPELLNLDSTTGATILAKGTVNERPPTPTFSIDYLVVAGGGGGGYQDAGGGGAGGFLTNTLSSINNGQSLTLTIGEGGAGGTKNPTVVNSGDNTVIAYGSTTITAIGGGGGASDNNVVVAASGGSGGGGAGGSGTSTGGAGTTGQGNAGGNGASNNRGGGGGGAGAAGQNATSSGANGGIGLTTTIISTTNAATASVGEVSGSNLYFAGGGGGDNRTVFGSGGLGGGTNAAANPIDAAANTGGGGGSAYNGSPVRGGAGGSGVIILKYDSSVTLTKGSGLTEASGSPFTEGSYKVSVFTQGTGNVTLSTTPDALDAINGTLRFNTETNKTEYYDGTGWYEIVDEYASGFIGPATNYFDTKLYTGNGATQSIGGYINGSASFNGSNSAIVLPNNILSSDFSISAWFYLNSTSGNQYLFEFDYENRVLFRVASTDNNWAYIGNSGYFNPGITYNAGQWYNVVITFSNGNPFKIYANGVLSYTSGNTSVSAFSNDNILGAANSSGSGAVNGSIDQVRIYNTALSSSDVTALYSETAATATTAAFPSGQTAIATYTMDTSANGLLNTQDLSTVNYPVGAGCIALYEMNGNSNDTSGTYNGTPANITYQGGAFDQAAVFNGSSSGINLPSSLNTSVIDATGAFSISMWINANDISTIQYLFSANTSNNIDLGINSNSQGVGKIVWTIYNTSYSYLISTTTITTNTWYNIVVTYDNGSRELFINGVSQGTATKTLVESSIEPTLGYRNTGGSVRFNGLMDQVRIYDSALTQAQVTTLARGIATSYSGAATNVNFNGHLDFAPDFVWVKNRTVAVNHYLYDSIRGTGPAKALHSNTTASEASASTYSVNGGIQSIDTNGFTAFAGTDTTYQGTNKSGNDYVSWNWKAGGAAVTNNDGTIASQVSANKDSGFSIVKYTTQASGTGTVGHGLGYPPEIVIVKTTGVLDSWRMYHSSLGAGYQIYLNLVNSAGPTANQWNNTAPTSSVFSLGTDNAGNYASIAYCWHSVAGYSKIGGYSGTGVSGKEVALDFNPGFVLIKRTNASTGWIIVDDQRGTKELYPNLSNAEDTTTTNIVLGTNKFTLNTTGSWYNASGGNYLYMAFA